MSEARPHGKVHLTIFENAIYCPGRWAELMRAGHLSEVELVAAVNPLALLLEKAERRAAVVELLGPATAKAERVRR